LLDTHPYSAQQIFQRLREEGYRGGITILRDYVRRIRPTKRPVYLKLHFAPGECAQVDWGAYGTVAVGNTRRRLSFCVMVLAFSRQMFVEFTVSQTMERFLACHEHAFAALGVPSKIMVDNRMAALLGICKAMHGTGPRTAIMTIMPARLRTARSGQPEIAAALYSAVVPGLSVQGSSARPSASGAPLASRAVTTASGVEDADPLIWHRRGPP
jgi:hypothetical protein